MRSFTRAATVGLLSASLMGLPLLPEAALAPLQVSEQRVSLAFAAEESIAGERDADDSAWVSAAIEGENTLVGITWDDADDAPDAAEVRVQVDGEWSPWQEVVVDDEHAPDPDSAEDRAQRGGSAPIVIEGAEAVQFRVTDETPPVGLAADLVDVAGSRTPRRLPAASAEAASDMPTIHGRDEWGGDACLPKPGTKGYEEVEYADAVEVLFVHHTTGYTSYSQSEVAGIVRSICSYHVNSKGWSDIGYNALIDRYGGIWEGRRGGLDAGPIGAHTGGFNSFSTGVAFIGDHHNGGAPTAAAQDALVEYARWKLATHNIDPAGQTTLTSLGSSRWREGTEVQFDNISGHRDASYTSCPGDSCYVLLDSFIERVASNPRPTLLIYGGRPADNPVERRENGRGWNPVDISFSFNEPAMWMLRINDDSGRTVLRETGEGLASTFTWNGRFDGSILPRGTYSVAVAAQSVSSGMEASTVAEAVLGLPTGEFLDVPTDSAFAEDVAWMASSGLTRGCNPPENTEFCPQAAVTRAQMAAFIVRALDLPTGPPTSFEDVPPTHPFLDEITALYNAGITRGCSRDAGARFCPNDSVSRQQMAAFLTRALELRGTTHPGFSDVGPTNPYWQDVRRLATANVTRGCNPAQGNTRFCPDGMVTRQQMAAFMRRAVG